MVLEISSFLELRICRTNKADEWWYSFVSLGSLLSELSLFNESESDTSGGEEWDNGLLAFSDNEEVVHSGGEGVSVVVLDVGNIETAGMFLDVLEDTDSTDVVTTDNQKLSTVLILDQALDFTGLKVQLFNKVI